MVCVGIEAKPTNVTTVAKKFCGAAESRTHLYDAPRYVGSKGSAEITFPIHRSREEFKLGPNIGKFF
jgi:hypothetical protein